MCGKWLASIDTSQARALAWSKKRLSLIKSLKSIAKRIELQTTPVHIAELWAYGSFIRPKEEPGDIDLTVFYRPDEFLDRRVALIQDFLHNDSGANEGLRKAAWDQAFEGKVDLLVDELDRLFGPDKRHRIWLEASRAEWLRLARNMGIYSMSIETGKVVRTILLGRMRNVHIEPTIGFQPLSAKTETLSERPYGLLWSEDARDIDSNLRLISQAAREAADRELPRFIEQFDQLDAEYSMIRMGVAYVLDQQKKGRDISEVVPSEILDVVSNDDSAFAKGKHTTGSVMEAGMVYWAREAHVNENFIASALTASSASYVKEFPDGPARTPLPTNTFDVEELRARSKTLTRRLPFARTLRSCLSNIGGRDEFARFAEADPVVEAVYLAYVGTPFYLATHELRGEVLQDLGLGHIRIPTWQNKGPPADRYIRPKDLKALEERRPHISNLSLSL